MPLVETLPLGPGVAQWPLWSTTARLVVTEPSALTEAVSLVRHQLAAVEAACSRFRPDSELQRLHRARGATVRVSPLLAELISAALGAAARTDGDVDPTIGTAIAALGYDRDFPAIQSSHSHSLARAHGLTVERSVPGWQRVSLRGRNVTVPDGTRLDLGATAKAVAADQCARLVADRCGVGVLVALGGDIATAGTAPVGGWRILVQDRPDDPQCTVAMPAGTAIATSSTVSRQWRNAGRTLHHVLDPRTCRPAVPVWRTASIVAGSCLDANTLSTAALIRGERAPAWLRSKKVPARLVSADRQVVTLGGWPPPVERDGS